MTSQIIEKLKELGYQTVSAEHYRNVDCWRQWYGGHVPSFHDFRVFNGVRHIPCRKVTAGLAKKACEDWADRLMNEKVKITLAGQQEQAFFDAVCGQNRFRQMMNRYQELCFALGSCACVARVSGIRLDAQGHPAGPAKALKLDFVTAEGIFPLSWENGRITECAFATETVKGEHCYCYLQLHVLGPDRNYVIRNRLFRKDGESLIETDPDTVPGFAGIAGCFYTGSDRPLFVLFRPNIANNLDLNCPLGISIFANAVDQLKTCDNIFDSFNSEFSLGRKRILVKPEGIRSLDGEPYFDPNDLVFYLLPEDAQNGSTVREMQATLRVEEHLTGMELALNMLAAKCGFGPGHWEMDRSRRTLATATEVISTDSAEFRTMKKHEIVLEEALQELAKMILKLGNLWFGMKLKEDVEISVDFDDSIIEDENTLFERDMKMLEKGILTPEEFRKMWRNEDKV